jgi:hypothetical protein
MIFSTAFTKFLPIEPLFTATAAVLTCLCTFLTKKFLKAEILNLVLAFAIFMFLKLIAGIKVLTSPISPR